MDRRRFRASDTERTLSVIGVLGLVVALGTVVVGIDGVAEWWRIALLLVGLFVVVLWALHAWRWEIALDEDGMTIAPGLNLPRRVPWDRFVAIRMELPAKVEVRGGQDVRFDGVSGPLLRGDQVRELDDAIRNGRADRHGTHR